MRHLPRCAWSVALALCIACRSEPAEPPPPSNALYELDLGELPAESSPGGLFGSDDPDLRTVVADIARLASDEGSKGLLVRLGSMRGAWGVRHDLAQALATYRAAEKPVHCHFSDTGNVGYALLAESCDRISMTPAGTLNLVGPVMQVLHARKLLESVGVEAELLQVGKYKGAAEPLTRDDMSEPLSRSLNVVLDDLDAELQTALAKRVEDTDAVVAQGPFTADEARDAGLIDGIDYDDAARAKAKTAAGAQNFQRLYEPEDPTPLDFGTIWNALTEDSKKDEPEGDRLAYVVLSGEIVDGTAPRIDTIVADPTIEALRRLADDDHVKAVVLRIDSPGGSALASDRIWHAVRRVAGRKPVAVSVGDMAASGGYYIASAGTRIFASPGSLVGSIGVVGGKVNLAKLADDSGVHTTTLKRGPRAAWLSPLTPFSESERARLEALLQRTYRLFLRRVGLGRDLSVEEVSAYAEGRLWTAKRALEGKLVDELSSLHEATLWAREQGGLPDDAPVETWPGEAEAMAAVTRLLGGAHVSVTGPQVRELFLRGASDDLVPAWLRALSRGEHVSAVLPVQLQLR